MCLPFVAGKCASGQGFHSTHFCTWLRPFTGCLRFVKQNESSCNRPTQRRSPTGDNMASNAAPLAVDARSRRWAGPARSRWRPCRRQPKRRFYVDEDAWTVLLGDHWDANGKLWQTGFADVIAMPDLPATAAPQNSGFYDRISGAAFLAGAPIPTANSASSCLATQTPPSLPKPSPATAFADRHQATPCRPAAGL